MSRVLLVRHAAFEGVGRVLVGRTAGVRLDATGRAQAAALAASLAAEPVAAVYSSPLDRAVETADPVAAAHGLRPLIEPAFTELDTGAWTGLSIEELADDPVWQSFNTARALTRIPGGEHMLDVQNRALPALLRLQQRHAGETVVVVSHGDVIRCVLAYLLAMPLDDMLRLTVDPACTSGVLLAAGAPQVLWINRATL